MHSISASGFTASLGCPFGYYLEIYVSTPLETSHSPVHVPHTIPAWLPLVWGCMGGTLLGLRMGLGPHAPLRANSSR
ncbi:hypothetical protein EDB86DRAFT_2921450 [Lactarius hatsudake]|nr:hypothetical protein EDB86DRAFT_2921450 [Lactarius hatsudake]